MMIRDLIPWRAERKLVPTRRLDDDPFRALQRDVNRLFDELSRSFGFGMLGGHDGYGVVRPRVDIAETDSAFEVTVELPGVDEKDINVSVTDDVLTIRGETKAEREEKDKAYYIAERAYGTFERAIALPPGIDTDKASAEFAKGVLTIRLPKSAEARAREKKIAIKAA
jgi:HSP20 family protein